MSGTGIALFLGHTTAGLGTFISYILIITPQAFVFMMSTLVYVGQAHDAHWTRRSSVFPSFSLNPSRSHS